jgi:RND family efflux transporter MFP subunit
MTKQPSVEIPAPVAAGFTEPTRAATADGPNENANSRSGNWLLGIGCLVAFAFAGSLVATTVPRLRHAKELDAAAARAAVSPPGVSVATARLAPATSEVTLPGNALAFREAALYARTTGYVKRWLADIGDRVKEGDLIAEITAPDVDAQLAQAQANLTQARANLPLAEANAELAKTTLSRDVNAGPGIGATLEQIDQDRARVKVTAAQVDATRATIQVNEAAVERFTVLQGFQKITAPFSGVVTVRNVDPGALVTADNPSDSREIFHVMQTDPLRVFVNVPQVFATAVAPGQQANVFRREDPLKRFTGRVTRTAQALDPNTRTLLTQVDVPNPDGALQPGMYLQVKFVAAPAAPSILIPSAALVTRNDGPEVAFLDENKAVRYRKVHLGRDYGAEVTVISGLNAGETIVVHPGDDLPEGTVVNPVPMPKQ